MRKQRAAPAIDLRRTKYCFIKIDVSDSLPDCYMSMLMQKSPGYTITCRTSPESENAFKTSHKVPVLYVVLRFFSSKEQEVPSWGGLISIAGKAPASLTIIDYYPPINYQITDFKTVQECLRYKIR